MAANEGVRLKLLMVKDDVSHPTGNGLAGVVLVQKIAGALAEASTSMDDIEAFCQQVRSFSFRFLSRPINVHHFALYSIASFRF